MRRYITLGILISLVLMFYSCDKFLKEFSQDLAYVNNCSDLDELLIGAGYMSDDAIAPEGLVVYDSYFPYIHTMDDDIAIGKLTGFVAKPTNYCKGYKHFYEWSDQLFINPVTDKEWEDTDWRKLYKHIAYLNVILAKAKECLDDPVDMRNRIEGEAHFLRGVYYYLLINLYANPYIKEKADTDLGVPLNLTEKIEDKYFERETLEKCYSIIVNDLRTAINKFEGIEQSSIYRANELAARILLSRVLLYMGEWETALSECVMAEKMCQGRLMDLNSLKDNETFLSIDNPEIVFTQGSSFISSCYTAANNPLTSSLVFQCSQELYNEFVCDETVCDLRKNVYFSLDTRGNVIKIVKTGSDIYDSFLIRTAELYLNKAEAEAMLDKSEDAVRTLKILLTKRYKGEKLPSLDGLQGESLISYIRNERRKELCFEGQRWFDLRRYAVSNKHSQKKSIRHEVYTKEGEMQGYVVLQPYGEDAAWVLPIPRDEIQRNQGFLIDNSPRIPRPLR